MGKKKRAAKADAPNLVWLGKQLVERLAPPPGSDPEQRRLELRFLALRNGLGHFSLLGGTNLVVAELDEAQTLTFGKLRPDTELVTLFRGDGTTDDVRPTKLRSARPRIKNAGDVTSFELRDQSGMPLAIGLVRRV